MHPLLKNRLLSKTLGVSILGLRPKKHYDEAPETLCSQDGTSAARKLARTSFCRKRAEYGFGEYSETLVDVSDIFYFFLVWGGGKGGGPLSRWLGGRPVLRKNRGGGGGFRGGGAGGGTAPGECLWEGGREQNIFFRARNAHQETRE